MHKELEAQMPCDEFGLRDYGQEMLTSENMEIVLKFLNCSKEGNLSDSKGFFSENTSMFSALKDSIRNDAASLDTVLYSLLSTEYFRPYHDMMYDVMQSFFESPVFGPDFHELFAESKELLTSADEGILNQYLSGEYFTEEMDKKFHLLILEELFTAVFSPEVMHYESILVRLQWLMVQFLVIRYILFLDTIAGRKIDDSHLKFRITRIFRVTDLPDILKIAFFDQSFRDWLWTPEYVQQLLFCHQDTNLL